MAQFNSLLNVDSRAIAVHLGSSTQNTCIRQFITGLTNKFYELSFDYAPVVTRPDNNLSEAYFIVKFNGRNVKNVLAQT